MATSDFQAMYAYKFHFFEMCFLICEVNVHRLFGEIADVFIPISVSSVTWPSSLHLTDDDCTSLIDLAKLCGTFEISRTLHERVPQPTLSAYLLIQSKLRLKHSAATFVEILRRVVSECLEMHDFHICIINRAMLTFV